MVEHKRQFNLGIQIYFLSHIRIFIGIAKYILYDDTITNFRMLAGYCFSQTSNFQIICFQEIVGK
jgi:hypothetical protein